MTLNPARIQAVRSIKRRSDCHRIFTYEPNTCLRVFCLDCLQARGYGKAQAGIRLVGTAGLARLGPRGPREKS
jgi:hypothetical protein